MKSFRSLCGQNYVNSNWLGDIQNISIGQNVFLKATVSPSQPGVGRADYSAWILIVPVGDNGYRIYNASCTCPAGFRESMWSYFCNWVCGVVMTWRWHGAKDLLENL